MLSLLMGRTMMLMVVVADRELAADQAPRLLTVVSRATYRYTNRHLIQITNLLTISVIAVKLPSSVIRDYSSSSTFSVRFST